MKKKVLKTTSPTYFRYEFSDETGRPEGGDIFQFTTAKSLQKMLAEVIAVAENDGVTVSLTLGKDTNFFQFLKNVGLSQKEVEKEMVDPCIIPFLGDQKASKSKKAAKKTRKK